MELQIDRCRLGLDAIPNTPPPGSSSPSPPSAPVSSGAGFDSSGNIDWSSLSYPSDTLSITNSGIRGSVPVTPALNYIRLNGNRLSGTIPDNLFVNLRSNSILFQFDLSHNEITGSIPPSLFDGLTYSQHPDLSGVTVFLNDNRLNGTLPSTLFSQVDSKTIFQVYLRNNSISGTLPVGIFPNVLVPSGLFTIDLAFNNLTGSIPSNMATIPQASTFNVSLAWNHLSGELPAYLFNSPGLTLTNNMGTNFLFDISHNEISGTIPTTFMNMLNIDSSYTATFVFSVNDNQLVGLLPSPLFPTISGGSMTINAQNNRFGFSPPAQCSSVYTLNINMSSNILDEGIPSPWGGCSMGQVDLSDNLLLSGDIPSGLLSTGITSFNARNTKISGTIPSIGSALTRLDLSQTNIDFCSPSSVYSMASFASAAVCNFSGTSACDCQATYSQCTSNCPCSLASRPLGGSQCVGGAWSNATTLVIPAGSGVVLIVGNLTSSSVVLEDLSSSLNITGCANDLSSVVVSLSDSEAAKIGSQTVHRLLATTGDYDENGNECANLTLVKVSAAVKDGCKKVKATKDNGDSGKTLSAYFTMSTSSCNLWWIILAASLGGAVLLAVILIVILVTCCSCCKKKVRPYAGSDSYLA